MAATVCTPFVLGELGGGDGKAALAALMNTDLFSKYNQLTNSALFSNELASVKPFPARWFVDRAQQLDAEGVLALKLLDA